MPRGAVVILPKFGGWHLYLLVSDDGSDVRVGVRKFREAHPATAWLYDIKHKTANLLEHALKHDASWLAFVEELSQFKRYVAVTALACLLPPQQRGKARYMSVDVLVDWGEKYGSLLDHPQAMREADLDPAAVEKKLGWLRRFLPQLQGGGKCSP